MIATCLRSGFRAALAHRKLVAAVWAWNLLLALVVGVGASRWLGAAFDFSPEADRMLQRFQFGLLIELQQYDRFSPFTFLNGTVVALVLVSAISNPLVSAGVLEVLVSQDGRPLLHRFFRGAGHFFGRFLRLLAMTAAVFVVLMIALTAITSPISRAFTSAGWERAWLSAAAFRFVLLGVVAALLMGVLDVARTRVVMAPGEARGMLRQWVAAARMALAHAGALAAILVVLGTIWIALALAGLGLVSATPVTNWAGIWLLIAVQQLFMLARAALRIARAGAVLELVSAVTPRAVSPAIAADLNAGALVVGEETIAPIPPP